MESESRKWRWGIQILWVSLTGQLAGYGVTQESLPTPWEEEQARGGDPVGLRYIGVICLKNPRGRWPWKSGVPLPLP